MISSSISRLKRGELAGNVYVLVLKKTEGNEKLGLNYKREEREISMACFAEFFKT